MIKAILIDDEPLARSLIKEYLQDYEEVKVVQECNDGFEGVKAITQHQPDIIFLDIQMPKINGFEMLELIEQPPAVVFTTAFDEYAIKAFENHAIDYLLKPFSKERFDKAIKKYIGGANISVATNTKTLIEAASQSPQQSQRVVVKTAGKIKIIPTEEIHFLEAADDYVKIYCKEGNYLKNKTLTHYEKLLNASQFVRTHRSYIVNVQYITRIDVHEKDSHIATLKTGLNVPVSKTGYSKLKTVLGL